MAKEGNKGMATFRFFEQTKFKADFYSRLEKESMNSLTQTALDEYCERLREKHGIDWKDFEHPEPGYSDLLMMLDPRFPWNNEEQARRRFVLQHKPFFFTNDKPDPRKLRVLWEKLEHYIEHWNKHQDDTWATGELMQKALKDAGQKPPAWGPRAEIAE